MSFSQHLNSNNYYFQIFEQQYLKTIANTKISDHYPSVFGEQKVFRLYISMHNILLQIKWMGHEKFRLDINIEMKVSNLQQTNRKFLKGLHANTDFWKYVPKVFFISYVGQNTGRSEQQQSLKETNPIAVSNKRK